MNRSVPGSILMGVATLFVLALVSLMGTTRGSVREAPSSLTGHEAPPLTTTALDGAPIQLSSLRGKVVLLNIWATWCGPCRQELPEFVALNNTYRDRGLALLGGVMNDDTAKAAAYAKDNELTWPQFEVTAEIARAYGGFSALPTSVLIDKQGIVRAVYVGAITRADIETKLKNLL